MTATANPDGLRPSRIRGGSPNSAGANEYPIASAYNSNIFAGDIVTNAAGYINVLATTTDKAMGVFIGCRYVVNGMLSMENQSGPIIGLPVLQLLMLMQW
jgi:hypothetical protein